MARDVSQHEIPTSLIALQRDERPYSYSELSTLKIPVLPDDTKLTLDQVKCILLDVIINNHANVFRAASVLTVPLFGDEFSKVEPFEYVVKEPPELQKSGTRLMAGLQCNECIELNDLYSEWGDERVQAQIIANTALLAVLTSPRDLHPHDAVKDEAFRCMNLGVSFAQFTAYTTLMDFLKTKGKTLSDLYELIPAPFIANFKEAVERRRSDLEASPCWYRYCHALNAGFVREFSIHGCQDIAYFGIAIKALSKNVNATVGDVAGVRLSEEMKKELCEHAKIVVRAWHTWRRRGQPTRHTPNASMEHAP
ncbi:unnamed protein product [Mesocestoides corti]|uniref:CHK domain-containing protein n=1 Tax=Mesocestoides corti TaxID=53468 RepID=A0A0R3UA88_MESCO|nr:unnamed protein product [Mesocestoides corti]